MSSEPYRIIPARSASSNLPTSSVTEPNSLPAATARATSVATRRKLACSSTSLDSSSRASALEIALATNSVNSRISDSMSAGRGSLWLVTAIIVPQSRPSTTIGVATPEQMPRLRATAATEPVLFAQLSRRAARPFRSTSAMTFSPSSANRVPSVSGFQGACDCATSVAVASGSKRISATASVSKTRAASSVTAPSTSRSDDSLAISVAVRRSAARSCASLVASDRSTLGAGLSFGRLPSFLDAMITSLSPMRGIPLHPVVAETLVLERRSFYPFARVPPPFRVGPFRNACADTAMTWTLWQASRKGTTTCRPPSNPGRLGWFCTGTRGA